MLEIFGTMVYIPTDTWCEVCEKTNFLDFLQHILANGQLEDDIILEAVMLIATICRTEKMAYVIS